MTVTILGSGMTFIDRSFVSLALPVLQVELNATVVDVQWVVEAYAIVLATLMLVGGSLSDSLGRRRVFACGVGLFAIASVWCGLAPDVKFLIVARAVQGIGGAFLLPVSLAILSVSFHPQQRGHAIGTWLGSTAVASALGLLLGGWVIEFISWRWMFFLNVPIALLILVILYWRVPESQSEEANPRLDWPGALLATAGLGAVVYGLVESARLGLRHGLVLGALASGAVLLSGFIIIEARSQAPMLPLRLFRSRIFRGANGLTFLLYAALGGVFFFLPFNLIQVQGYSAIAAGAAFLPLIVCMSLLSRWAGGLVVRTGAQAPLVSGPCIFALGCLLLALPGIGGSYWATFFPGITVLGLGMAVTVAPLTTVVMGAVETRHAGGASGINSAVARTAGLLSIAVLGIVMTVGFNTNLDERLATFGLSPEAQHFLDGQRIKLAAAEIPAGLSDALKTAVERAIAESFVASFRLVMSVAASLALLGALTARLTIKQ